MSILPRKARACVECALMKVGCHQPADAEGPHPCERCAKKGLCCTPRVNPLKTPCEECKDAHLGCDGLPEGPCTLCVRRGEACSFVGASPPTASPAQESESEYECEAGPAPSPPGSPSPTSEAMSPPPAPPPSPASDVDVSSACGAVVQPPLTRPRFLDVVLRPPTP